MATVIKEADDELGAEEKMIALKILLVIYLHEKRYLDALADIEKLLDDPEMQSHREYLLLKQAEVRRVLVGSAGKKEGNLLKFFRITFPVF